MKMSDLGTQMVRDLDEALCATGMGYIQHGYWIPCKGKSHIWYCSVCGERINYNQARRTYKPEVKPVYAVNKWCRGCGAKMDLEGEQ